MREILVCDYPGWERLCQPQGARIECRQEKSAMLAMGWGNGRFQICYVEVKVKALAVQSCPTLCHRMGCSLPGSSGHWIFQARILEWVTIPFSRGLSQPRGQTWVSHIAGRFFTTWITSKAEVRWGVAVKVSGEKRRQTLRGESTVDSWRPAPCLPKAQPSSELTSNDSQQSLKKQNSQRSMWEIALVFGRRPWPELPVFGNIWKEAFSLKRKGCRVKPARGTRRRSWKSEASPASVSITATKGGFIRGLPKWNFETSRDISCKFLRSDLEIQMIISLLGIWDS